MRSLLARSMCSLVLFLTLAASGAAVHAQDLTELELRLARTFGYQSGLQVQGSFNARVSGPDSLVEVTLYVDGEVAAIDRERPFSMPFTTSEFAPGEHTIWVEGMTETGDILRSAERRLIFLSPDEAIGSVTGILVPIFLVIGIGSLIFLLVNLRSPGHEDFRLGEYGAAGGAICRRCGLPFSRHFLSPNLVVGKLERCPHCGHWAIVPRAATSALAEAEARYESDQDEGSYKPPAKDEEWKRRLEDSRYDS